MSAHTPETDRELRPLKLVKRFAEGAGASTGLELESEAALRQFSLERLTSYGVDCADAKELRDRVGIGERWLTVAQDLAMTCLSPPELAAAPASPYTMCNRLYRASALYRMSQMMFLSDNDERRSILAESVRLYSAASRISADRQSITIQTDGGLLAGWLHPSAVTPAVGCAIVIGGVEGWAMDFASLGAALTRRGIHALLLDGPGQGQSRLEHGHYLTKHWTEAYNQTIDFVEKKFHGLPVGFVGNSMGGAIGTLVAAFDARIRACVNNGGPMYGTRAAVDNPSFFKKMIAQCGEVSTQQAMEVWSTILPLSCPHSITCPYLVLHGGKDPLVSSEEAMLFHERATAVDKVMFTFSDGIHCVYNHESDKQDLIADWLASRLRWNDVDR